MLSKLWLPAMIILLLVGGFFAARSYLSKNINPVGLVTNLGESRKEITKFFPQGSQLSFPLTLPQGFTLGIFADLEGDLPRVLAFDPAGTLVTSIPARGKVLALPDKDKNGQADEVIEIATGLNRPHGIAFDSGFIYIAETDKVIRGQYNPETKKISSTQKLFDLPSGGGHFTRTIKINGQKLYTSVGSSCNVCIEDSQLRSAVLVSDLDGGGLRVFAKGLRNTVFFAFDSQGRMWGVDMGRDLLGDNLPPDEVNLIQDGKDYGWPYCYGNKIRDSEFQPGEAPNYCEGTQASKFNLPSHVAPLGVAFIDSPFFANSEQGNLLVSLHGSWNSSVPVGYKIVKLTFSGEAITKSDDFITGFLSGNEVLGRPVGLVFDEDGYLYISDDKAGLIYILSKSSN